MQRKPQTTFAKEDSNQENIKITQELDAKLLQAEQENSQTLSKEGISENAPKTTILNTSNKKEIKTGTKKFKQGLEDKIFSSIQQETQQNRHTLASEQKTQEGREDYISQMADPEFEHQELGMDSKSQLLTGATEFARQGIKKTKLGKTTPDNYIRKKVTTEVAGEFVKQQLHTPEDQDLPPETVQERQTALLQALQDNITNESLSRSKLKDIGRENNSLNIEAIGQNGANATNPLNKTFTMRDIVNKINAHPEEPYLKTKKTLSEGTSQESSPIKEALTRSYGRHGKTTRLAKHATNQLSRTDELLRLNTTKNLSRDIFKDVVNENPITAHKALSNLADTRKSAMFDTSVSAILETLEEKAAILNNPEAEMKERNEALSTIKSTLNPQSELNKTFNKTLNSTTSRLTSSMLKNVTTGYKAGNEGKIEENLNNLNKLQKIAETYDKHSTIQYGAKDKPLLEHMNRAACKELGQNPKTTNIIKEDRALSVRKKSATNFSIVSESEELFEKNKDNPNRINAKEHPTKYQSLRDRESQQIDSPQSEQQIDNTKDIETETTTRTAPKPKQRSQKSMPAQSTTDGPAANTQQQAARAALQQSAAQISQIEGLSPELKQQLISALEMADAAIQEGKAQVTISPDGVTQTTTTQSIGEGQDRSPPIQMPPRMSVTAPENERPGSHDIKPNSYQPQQQQQQMRDTPPQMPPPYQPPQQQQQQMRDTPPQMPPPYQPPQQQQNWQSQQFSSVQDLMNSYSNAMQNSYQNATPQQMSAEEALSNQLQNDIASLRKQIRTIDNTKANLVNALQDKLEEKDDLQKATKPQVNDPKLIQDVVNNSQQQLANNYKQAPQTQVASQQSAFDKILQQEKGISGLKDMKPQGSPKPSDRFSPEPSPGGQGKSRGADVQR